MKSVHSRWEWFEEWEDKGRGGGKAAERYFFRKKWIFFAFLNFLLNFFVEKVYFRNVLGGFVSFCWSDHVFDMAEYDFRPAHSMDYHKRTARPM